VPLQRATERLLYPACDAVARFSADALRQYLYHRLDEALSMFRTVPLYLPADSCSFRGVIIVTGRNNL